MKKQGIPTGERILPRDAFSPLAVIGVPACTAVPAWLGKVKKGLLISSLPKYPRG
ncbi:hypothetical protein [Pseudogemmobacter sonorensis]|uniref:hypothetical protein n=1 Tax=Pseudogemmobacter sonorensis TaxID=2989681 RepID=UPI0036A5DFF0